MSKYRPGKSGVPTRKVKEIKKKISKEKGKDKSDKDRIAELEKKLAMLLAKTQQDVQGGKNISDADVKRAKISSMYMVPDDYDGFMNEETMAELRAGASQKDLEQGVSRIKGKKNYQPLPESYKNKPSPKKGGGHVKKYTGGKSGDKYYGGGPVYPRPAKGD